MHTLLAVANTTVLAAPASGSTLATTIRDWVAPLFLLAISFAAMTFLFRRQLTEFLQFAALGVGVAVFFYFPGVVEGVASVVSGALGGGN